MAPRKRSPAKPSDKAEWLILNSADSAERRKHLLGAVVPKLFQYNPFDSYSPHWEDEDLDAKVKINKTGENQQGNEKETEKRTILRDTMEKLWHSNRAYGERAPKKEDTPVRLTDILTGKVGAKTREMRNHVTDIFNLYMRKEEVQEVEIEAGQVIRYKIDNSAAKLPDTLMRCGPWKEQLQKLFDRSDQRKSPYLLVTGILICKDLEVRWKRDTATNIDTKAKVDGNAVLAALHQPPNPELAKYLDSEFSFNQEKSTKENVFATCKQDIIFAVRYNYLTLTFEKAPEEKEPSFWSRVVLRQSRPGTIKSGKVGSVVLGKGIMSYASAVAKENEADEEEGPDGTENQDLEEEEEKGDWFYSRPAPGLAANGPGDETDDAASSQVYGNGTAERRPNGRA
jgi:hypothetical protein